MSIHGYLPLVAALGLVTLLAMSTVNHTIDRILTRISLALFRDFVEQYGWNQLRREQLLRGIHSTTTYPVYATKTILISFIGGIVGFVGSMYFGLGVLSFLIAHRDAYTATVPKQMHFIVVTDETSGLLGNSDMLEIPLISGPLYRRILPDSVVWIIDGILLLLPPWVVPSFPDVITIASSGADTVGEVEVLVRLPGLTFLPESIAALTVEQLLLLTSWSVTVGVIAIVGVYLLRWQLVKDHARSRRLLINRGIPPTVAFIYASSRSGMTYPEIMRTIALNHDMFGETAKEIGVVVKEMDLFGIDLIRALQGIAQQTPSDQFGEFADSLASALQSGQNVSEFLHTKHEQFKNQQEVNQEQILEILAALGEGYVALLVAGPLFLITILTIFGFLTGELHLFIQLIVYLLVPLANIGFMLYLDVVTKPLTSSNIPSGRVVQRRPLVVRRTGQALASDIVPDGGTVRPGGELNLRRLALHKWIDRLLDMVTSPFETVTRKPVTLLYVTVPLGLASILVRWWMGGDGGLRVIDDYLIQATLGVVTSFAIVYEYHSKRLRDIETVVPDFLDNLASTNAAGKTFTGSLKRVDRSGLGPLNVELERLLVDIEWGGRTEHALYRFSERLGSSTVAMIVALITNAMRASGNIGYVIRIAAAEARRDLQLKRRRRQEMFVYVVVVYISFIVFLGIATVIQTILVPAVPTGEQFGSGISGGTFGPRIAVSTVDAAVKAEFTLLLFHASAIQAVCAGFVAGQMGEGRVAAGAKHVAIMLTVAYGVFFLIG